MSDPNPLAPSAAGRPPTIDPVAAARWHARTVTDSAWLHDEVARRMEERLDWILREPRHWVHWEPLQGGHRVHARLAARYPQAQCWLVQSVRDAQHPMLKPLTPPWWHPARWRGRVQAGQVPPAGEAGLLWANMALHMAPDPQALMARWHAALAVDGFVMFSCLGPDTLRELRTMYQRQGWPAPAHEFTDMHDWGDMLVQAGFAEPVMDMERIELTFETPQRLLQELRELGRNLHPQRFTGLRGRAWRTALGQALLSLAVPAGDGRLTLTFEIIYGHAFKPPPRMPVAPHSTLSLEEMRQTLRQRRGAPPSA